MVVKVLGGLVTAILDAFPLAAQPPLSELQSPALIIQSHTL